MRLTWFPLLFLLVAVALGCEKEEPPKRQTKAPADDVGQSAGQKTSEKSGQDDGHSEAERKSSPGQPPVEKTMGERPSTPEAAVKHALELISAGDITTFLTTYMPPEALQKEVDRAGSLEQLAAKLEPFVNRVIKVALLEMDRKIPTYSDDGKTATYKIFDVSAFNEAVFKKIGSRWYLEP